MRGVFNTLISKISQATPKQLVVAIAFTLALAGAIGLGTLVNNHVQAATLRDCDKNSIDYEPINGGCGATSAKELVADARDNRPSDLQKIYSYFSLTPDEYDRFAKTAQWGEIRRNGDVYVGGKKVLEGGRSMGRHNFGGSQSLKIGDKTYYHGTPEQRWADGVQSIPAMVMFDSNGTVEVAIMGPCGNPVVNGKRIESGAKCEMLNKTAVEGKLNTYKFSADVSKYGHAKIEKVEYFANGQSFATETDPSKQVEYTFTEDAEVEVKVHISLPGNNKKAVTSAKCKTHIEVEQPYYTCEKLVATARDNTNRSFRFTVIADYGNGATLKDVDFVLDGTNETKGVTEQDDEGNIYKDYDFTDAVEHEIIAKVNFNVNDTVETKACAAKVTPTEEPKCPYNPELPPESPDCKQPPEECKPGIPVGDDLCNPEPELPNTGAGSMLGLFTGVSIAGGAAHRLYLRFRQ